MGTTAEKLAYLAESKEQIRQAIEEMGVSVPSNTPFRQYGEKIEGIPRKAAQTYMPGTKNQTIEAGQYLTGNQTITGDANLLPENIVSGKSIFGVEGSAPGKGVAVFKNKSASLSVTPYGTSDVSFNIGKNAEYAGWNAYICNIDIYGMYGMFMRMKDEFAFSKVSWNSTTGYVTATLTHTDEGFSMRELEATIILVEP